MKPINANEADYERFELLGHDALFTCLRIDRKTLPEGLHDLCFPTTPELRKQLNGAVAEAYKQAIVQLQEQSNANFQQTEQSYEATSTMSM